MIVNIGLDRLTLTVTPVIAGPYVNYVKQIKSLAVMKEDIVFANGIYNGYRVAVRIKIDGLPADGWPVLQIAPFDNSKGYFRLECNPNRLGPGGVAIMKDTLDTSTPQGWPLSLKSARATRIDVNCDAQGLSLDDVLVRTKKGRCTEIWSRSGDIQKMRVETIYLGNKGQSKKIYRVYRLGPEKIAPGYSATTRFESADRATRPLLLELHKCAFPFDQLVTCAASAPAPDAWPAGRWKMFLRIANDHGLQVAWAHLDAPERKQAKKALEKSPVAGLDFAGTWKQWPELISKLGLQVPGSQGGFLPGFAEAA